MTISQPMTSVACLPRFVTQRGRQGMDCVRGLRFCVRIAAEVRYVGSSVVLRNSMTGKPDSSYQFFDVSDEIPQCLTSPRTSSVYNFESISKGTVAPSSPCRGGRESDFLHDCSNRVFREHGQRSFPR
jgi:hypothetical protein